MGLLVIVDNPPRSQFCQVASEPGVGTAGAGEEEGVPERAGGEGEGPGEAELGAGGEALHAAEREPDAQTGTVRTSKITFSEAVVLVDCVSSPSSEFQTASSVVISTRMHMPNYLQMVAVQIDLILFSLDVPQILKNTTVNRRGPSGGSSAGGDSQQLTSACKTGRKWSRLEFGEGSSQQQQGTTS